MIVSDIILSLITGIATGILSSLFGLGGGIFIIPVLVSGMGLPRTEAIASSLLILTLNSLINVVLYQREKKIDWNIALQIGLVSGFVSFFCSLNIQNFSPTFLKHVFSFFLLTVLFSPLLFNPKSGIYFKRFKKTFCTVIGALSGAASGLTGVGGGGLVSPVLVYSEVVDHRHSAATTNAIILTNGFFACLPLLWNSIPGFPVFSPFHLDKVLVIFGSSILGAKFGIRWNNRLPKAWRKGILTVLLLVILGWNFWK